jgi:hypothetical protein
MFDWLRELYSRMRYIVRHDDELSQEFKSLLGLFTGDTASPIMWNIFFADMAGYIKDDPDDIILHHLRIFHLEQADDVVLFSTTQAGLQRKLDQFFAWCRANATTVSTEKTQWMVFGPAPRQPWMRVNGQLIALTTSYKYVGITFSSVHNDMFATHYDIKGKKATNVCNIIFTLHSLVGDVTPTLGYRMYMARADPHLTFGCEVSLDTNDANIAKLEKIQARFLRRLLGVHPRSILAPMYTETGTIPIRYRRALLALRALDYICSLPDSHYAHAALADSVSLAALGHQCWASDLVKVLSKLAIPVAAHASTFLTRNGIQDLVLAVEQSWQNSLEHYIHASDRLCLLHHRLVSVEGTQVYQVDKMQPYLNIPIARHRRALYTLLTSGHHLAVERQRYNERGFSRRPRELRICRFCLTDVEDEHHALFSCCYTPLVELRRAFLNEASLITGSLQLDPATADITLFSRTSNISLLNRFARFVYEIFCIYENAPMCYLPNW